MCVGPSFSINVASCVSSAVVLAATALRGRKKDVGRPVRMDSQRTYLGPTVGVDLECEYRIFERNHGTASSLIDLIGHAPDVDNKNYLMIYKNYTIIKCEL